MRPKHPHAAESGVGKHTARESEAPNCVPSGKSAWRTPTPKFGPGTARFRGLIVFAIRGAWPHAKDAKDAKDRSLLWSNHRQVVERGRSVSDPSGRVALRGLRARCERNSGAYC